MKIKKDSVMMFYQQAKSKKSGEQMDKIRLFYPNGYVEFFWLESGDIPFYQSCFTVNKHISNIRDAIKLANKWDKECGYPKMEFLGYL